jgi:acetolactate synthase-1/2/3 large subunit
MGYAIPAALAATNAFPERVAVAVCGDGGFAMSMNGLISSIELGLRIIVVVFNNAQLGAVVYDTGAFGALFQDFDHAAMARGIGCLGVRVDAAADLEGAFREALASDKSAVIDVRITAEASFRHAMPPSLD